MIDHAAEDGRARAYATVLPKTPPQDVTVEMWLSGYRLLFPDERAEKTRRDQEAMLCPFRRAHGDLRVWDVSPLLAQQWALDHPAQVRMLRRAWDKAVLMRVAPVNIWRLVVMPKRGKEKVRAPSHMELWSIVARCGARSGAGAPRTKASDPWWLEFSNMVDVAAHTGAREGGLIRLKRSDVELALGRMTVTEKGGKTRVVALCGPALAAMRRQLGCLPRTSSDRRFRLSRDVMALVFRGADGQPLTNEAVQKAWREVRGDFPHGFHSLKHYAATWLRAQGVSELDVAMQLGHVDGAGRPYPGLVRRVYDHPDAEAALARISAVVG